MDKVGIILSALMKSNTKNLTMLNGMKNLKLFVKQNTSTKLYICVHSKMVILTEFYHFHRNECKTRFEQVCSPKQEKVCQTRYVEKCQSLSKSNCYTAYKESPYEDTECNDKYVAECPQEWQISGAGVKVWTPDTSKCFDLVSKANNN